VQEEMLLPELDEESAPFFDYAAAGELRVQRCSACGTRRVPPRPMCHACGSTDVEWELLSGRGRVWSFAVPHPPLLPAYAAVAPYNVVVVEAEEDPAIRFVGNLVGSADGPLNEIDPESIEIGEPVTVVFSSPVDDGLGPVVLPRWVRAS